MRDSGKRWADLRRRVSRLETLSILEEQIPKKNINSFKECSKRGPEVRRVECGSCESRRVELRVFQCREMGECAMVQGVPDVQFCGTCAHAPT